MTYMDFWKDAKQAGLSDTQACNYAKEQMKLLKKYKL